MSLADVLRRARAKADDRALRRAEELQETARELHRSAPRGGVNRNRYGQPRSAPGEPPATEEGRLLERLDDPPQPIARGYRAAVNYRVLEDGYSPNNLEPRPLGRLALDALKARVRR